MKGGTRTKLVGLCQISQPLIKLKPVTTNPEKSSSESESEALFVSQEDPASAAAELGASGAKLIGGSVLGLLWFESTRS